MYTVRNFCRDLEGFKTTLEKIADIGYKTVQVSGVCDYEPAWLKEQLERTGLQCVITHPDDERFFDPQKIVADHKVFGCKYIGLGCMPKGSRGLAEIDQFIETFRPLAKGIRENGGRMMYHHHHYEFGRDEQGERYLDKILRSFPAEDLGLTLDTYWVQVGGANPAELLKSLKGRVPCIHLKDLAISGVEQHMAPVGSGNINFEKVLAAAEAADTEFALVEQDESYEEDPFVCLKKSYDYLRSLGLR